MGSRGRVRSNAWIWVFSSTHKTNALSGGLRYRPTISRTFSIKSGSDDSLKVSVRWGCSPKARHMRLMVLWLRPERLAIERVLQWVASVGVVSRVMLTTLSTSASAVLRGVPGLGSSSSPSTRRSKNRDLHFPTVGLDTLSSSATAVFVFPSAHPSIIRARWANACAVFGRRAHAPSVSRSSLESVNGGVGRPGRRMCIPLK